MVLAVMAAVDIRKMFRFRARAMAFGHTHCRRGYFIRRAITI